MEQTLLLLILGLNAILIILVIILLFTKNKGDTESLHQQLQQLQNSNMQLRQDDRLAFNQTINTNYQQLSTHMSQLQTSIHSSMLEFNQVQAEKGDRLTVLVLETLDKMRLVMEQQLQNLIKDNHQQLDQMRLTVDEKLQASVEKRFNESFKSISDRLDQVQQGLGEMNNLASGVGDLKKVLTNVKTRGALGEIQLQAILEQVLAPNQYEQNKNINPETMERVEFAIKLPGKRADDVPIFLPIDSKFPLEDYQRLLQAFDNNQPVEPAIKALEAAVKKNAKDIASKYIYPPVTTDFAIMFVPTEGLYAEILRIPGLFEYLQRDLKISVVGPSNLVAFLNSLQMGFKTLAIQQRSTEVWQLLLTIKNEFDKFEGILDKTKKKLQEATSVIEQADTRTRVISSKLKKVQLLKDTVEADEILEQE